MITWGTSPQDVITIDGKIPNPNTESDQDKKNSIERALNYMGLKPDMAATDIVGSADAAAEGIDSSIVSFRTVG